VYVYVLFVYPCVLHEEQMLGIYRQRHQSIRSDLWTRLPKVLVGEHQLHCPLKLSEGTNYMGHVISNVFPMLHLAK